MPGSDRGRSCLARTRARKTRGSGRGSAGRWTHRMDTGFRRPLLWFSRWPPAPGRRRAATDRRDRRRPARRGQRHPAQPPSPRSLSRSSSSRTRLTRYALWCRLRATRWAPRRTGCSGVVVHKLQASAKTACDRPRVWHGLVCHLGWRLADTRRAAVDDGVVVADPFQRGGAHIDSRRQLRRALQYLLDPGQDAIAPLDKVRVRELRPEPRRCSPRCCRSARCPAAHRCGHSVG